MAEMKLMDVTLRESVYYGAGIDYSKALLYLDRLNDFITPDDVRYVEIGYINTEEIGHLNYDEKYLLDAGEINNRRFNLVGMMHPGKADLDKFNSEAIKQLSMVRIVCGGTDVPDSVGTYIEYFHNLGIKVGVNVSFALNKSYAQLAEMCSSAYRMGADCIYLADSTGSASIGDINRLCDLLKTNCQGKELGFHLHDHMNMAFANATQLVQNGIDITDVSITGAGRGGGNLRLELMILYLTALRGKKISLQQYQKLLAYVEYFEELIDRKSGVYSRLLVDTSVAFFKLPLDVQGRIDAVANGNCDEYIEQVYKYLDKD